MSVACKTESKREPEFTAQCFLESPTVTIRDVYCQGCCGSQSAEECATATELVFPYRGVYVRHLGDDQAVAEANQVSDWRIGIVVRFCDLRVLGEMK